MNSYKKIFLIFVHVLLWGVIIIIPKFFMPAGVKISMRNELLLWPAIIVFFYINYFYLVPYLLTRKKFLLFTFSILAILTISMLLGRFAEPTRPPRLFINFRNAPASGFAPDPRRTPRFEAREMRKPIFPFNALRNLTTCFLFLAIGTSIRVTEQWYINEKQRKDMENQKLTAELSFLKSQINPHFFFNTLNSIYSLAISKSDKTPEAIIKLSELMRFIIYESEKESVPLRRELDYINNFVELQKLRLMSNITVNYRIEGDLADLKIEPLILLPFIENAFKHGIDSIKKCVINILVKVSSSQLWLTVENPVVKLNNIQTNDSQGIGLANSKKRLQLVYGSNHTLNITQTNDSFKVELKIILNTNELHNS
jgi:sensor histidine kinase YesM